MVAVWRGRPLHELTRQELESAYTAVVFELDRERRWALHCTTMSGLFGASVPSTGRPPVYPCPDCGVAEGAIHRTTCPRGIRGIHAR